MEVPSWTEIIGLLTVSLGWAEFIRRIWTERKRNKRPKRRKKRK